MIDYEKHGCKDCLWHNQCGKENICDDFSPVYELGDRYINIYIVEKRREFYEEWLEFFEEENI